MVRLDLRVAHHVEAELHVRAGELPAVAVLDALAQVVGVGQLVVADFPAGGQSGQHVRRAVRVQDQQPTQHVLGDGGGVALVRRVVVQRARGAGPAVHVVVVLGQRLVAQGQGSVVDRALDEGDLGDCAVPTAGGDAGAGTWRAGAGHVGDHASAATGDALLVEVVEDLTVLDDLLLEAVHCTHVEGRATDHQCHEDERRGLNLRAEVHRRRSLTRRRPHSGG